MDFTPHAYQMRAIEKMAQNPGFALLLDPGLGKTSIALAALSVFKHHKVLGAMLVIAPLRPMMLTWPAEVAKWDQFKGLRVSIIHGGPTQRRAAMAKAADVYLTNPENVAWLAEYVATPLANAWGETPKMLVVDESTRFKNQASQRFKALRAILPMFDRSYILTGTPVPQSVEDLFAQMQLVDRGERLGRFITHFRKTYMQAEQIRVGGGRVVEKWHPMPDAAERIFKRIGDVALRLQAEDYLKMPKLTVNDIVVELPPAARKVCKDLEGTLVAKLASGETLTAATAAAVVMKLRQVVNGVAYGEEGATHLHDAKLDALADLVEEQSGQPLLVAVAFLSEVKAIRERLGIDAPYLGGGVTRTAADNIVAEWNAGKLPVLLVHPTSVAHGLNLQAGGHAVCWFGLTWNLEEYLQCNARVYRQGQERPVVIHRIVAKDTVDQDIAEALGSKADLQSTILNRLKKGQTS